ncbi:(2Fe-2S)-binding protein [Acetobacteraceae bacterium H6797]|nr:(2Fe-2S)-binding protein [Acetobacteraceae bacterium H6797]
MFQRLPEAAAGATVAFTLDGQPVTARAGDTVAAAVFALGRDACRQTAVTGAERGPYCMMGVCFDCLMTIDGIGNRQACLVRIAPGMAVETQHGKRVVGQ